MFLNFECTLCLFVIKRDLFRILYVNDFLFDINTLIRRHDDVDMSVSVRKNIDLLSIYLFIELFYMAPKEE